MNVTEANAVNAVLDVFVPGKPVTKGNLAGFKMGTRIKLTEKAGDEQRAWMAYLRDVAGQAWAGAPTTAAVHVHTEFVMPRRAGAPKTRTDPHTRRPDGDKLTRAVWDALTHVVFADDAQICGWSGVKREAELNETPGCRIRVTLP